MNRIRKLIFSIKSKIKDYYRSFKNKEIDDGTTFVEILVTMAIIAILMTTITIGAIVFIQDANKAKARNDIATMRTAITSYYLSNYDYPDPGSWEQDIKKYVEDGKVPKDPWGQAYQYTKPGPEEAIPYEIRSAGPNKNLGDEDDIVSWDLGNKQNNETGGDQDNAPKEDKNQ
jgi:general secretion pathway protein G